MDNKIPPTVSTPVTISSQAVTVSMSPALTTTANTSCSNLLSYAQSLPSSVSSTSYNLSDSFVTGMPFSQSYSWPAVATGPNSSTGRTYTQPQGPTFSPLVQPNLGSNTLPHNLMQGTSTHPQSYIPSVFANTRHLQFWNFYKPDPQGSNN